mgnify:CR=1 FL=1
MSRTFFQRQLMAVLAAISLIQLHAGEAIAQTQAQRMSDAAAAAKIFGESQKLENLDSLFKIDQGTGDITFNPGQRESKFGIGELFPGATVDSSADLQSLYSLRRLGLKCPLGTCPKEVLALTILLTTHYPLPTTTYYVLRTTHYYLPLTTHH